jgi:hypothetical protein
MRRRYCISGCDSTSEDNDRNLFSFPRQVNIFLIYDITECNACDAFSGCGKDSFATLVRQSKLAHEQWQILETRRLLATPPQIGLISQNAISQCSFSPRKNILCALKTQIHRSLINKYFSIRNLN